MLYIVRLFFVVFRIFNISFYISLSTVNSYFQKSESGDRQRVVLPTHLLWSQICNFWLREFEQFSRVIYGIFWRPFVKRFALCYRTVFMPVLSCHACNVGVYGQTVGWIKMKFCTQLGPSYPTPKKRGHSSPQIIGLCFVAKRLDGSSCHLVGR